MDDTFALDGGKEATRWKARRNWTKPGKRPYFGGGRKKIENPEEFHLIGARFSKSSFAKLDRLAAKNGLSLSKQIVKLCEQILK